MSEYVQIRPKPYNFYYGMCNVDGYLGKNYTNKKQAIKHIMNHASHCAAVITMYKSTATYYDATGEE